MTWETVRLRDLARVDAGTVQPERIRPDLPYVGLESIGRHGVIAESVLAGSAELKSAKNSYDERHVLFGKLRPNLGKVARPSMSGVCSTDIYPLLPNVRIDRAYLAHYLLTESAIAYSSGRATGVNLPRVTWSALGELPIPLPPLPEQRRIAAILDEADALRNSCRREAQLLEDASKALFDRAIQGAGQRAPLGTIVDLITGPFGSSVHKHDYILDGVPLINPSHIVNGEIRADARIAVGPAKAKELAPFWLREGDVVLGRRGDMGRTALVRPSDLPAICGTGTMVLRSSREAAVGAFIARLLRTPRYVAALTNAASGVTMLNLSQAAVASALVPVPTPALESRVTTADAISLCLRRSIERRGAELDALFASLQHRAFRGEL